MTWPHWRPMPSFSDDPEDPEYAHGAIVRSHHRTLMRLRWRNPDLRATDKQLRRLPEDWHTWMLCPADDQNPPKGYRGSGCTCDTWLKPDARPVTDPRAQMVIERKLRATLQKELMYSFKAREAARAGGPCAGSGAQ